MDNLLLDQTWKDAHGPEIIPMLKQWRELKRVPQSLLITGSRGVGKREIATWIAQSLQCENSGFTESQSLSLFGDSTATLGDSPVACGTCPNCDRFQKGTPLDFQEILPLEDSKTLKIDQFREIKETQGFSAFGSGYRIILIPDAEKLTNQAANALLKILEEPPQGWVFILTTSDTSLLPATVISRCQKMRLKPLLSSHVQKLLEKSEVEYSRISVAVALCGGSFKQALEFTSDEVWQKRAPLLKFIERPSQELNTLVDWASQSHQNTQILIDQFELLIYEILSQKQINTDAKNILQKIEGTRPRQFWESQIIRLFKMRKESQAPLNLKLLLQDFLLPWLQN